MAPSEKRMKRARTAAQLELEPIAARFRKYGWDAAFGTSGTMRAARRSSLRGARRTA